ncbi:MAG: C25 family cysteine peptidase [Candidatus Omnitrophica bacterium]|nr:C25 family cysteine peptidase [Candidatus Omnitrophota bacterium]
MIKVQTKNLIVFFTIIGFVFNASSPGIAQINPTWGNHEPNGTGNTLPPYPNGGTFVRQDPMPENMQDITILSSDHKGISLEVEFPDVFDYELAQSPSGQDYRRYKASGEFKVLGDIGSPEVLHRIIWLQIPKDAKNIKINKINLGLTDFKNENIDLYPIPEIVFKELDNGIMASQEVFTINEDVYLDDKPFPDYQAKMIEEGFKHDMHIIKISVPTLFYYPKEKTTQRIKLAQIKISYESSNKNNKFIINTGRDPFHKVFNALIPNYAYEKSSEQTPSLGSIVEVRGEDLTNPSYGYHPDYLVVAAKIFDEDPLAHEQLMNWASYRAGEEGQQGGDYKIAIAYVDEIHLAYSQALVEESIKEFTRMVYKNWRPSVAMPTLKYLLLVGDADIGGNAAPWFLPTWRSSEESLDAGDNDYVWLVGDDTLNDVMLGRLPAKDAEELGIMVSKIINFENNPPQGENHYGTRSILLAGNYANQKLIEPKETSTIIRDLLLHNKQEIDEFDDEYFPKLGNVSDFFRYDSTKITDILNEDGALFVGYQAHGSPVSWFPPVNPFELTNIDKLPALVLSHACNTAKIDHSNDCLGERWLKHEDGGAVCFFGATRGPSIGWLDQAFYSIFKNHLYTSGQAIDKTRETFLGHNGCERNHKIHILLGDPALDFSGHIGQSTKPDFTSKSTTLAPELPTNLGEVTNISCEVHNNSEQQDVENVTIKLLSINGFENGDVEKEELESWDIPLFLHQTSFIGNYEWTYAGESARHFMTWPDPDDTIDELSEINNCFNSQIKYFPIYVDKSNASGIEHGTQQYPYSHLLDAVEHAQLKDKIGDSYKPDPQKSIEIYLNDGSYGDGNTIFCKSLALRSLNGPDKTTVYDKIYSNGASVSLEGITFDGRYATGSAVYINPTFMNTNDEKNLFVRNIFKNWDDNAFMIDCDILHSVNPKYILNNNIFTKNYRAIRIQVPEEQTYRKSSAAVHLINNTIFNNENNLHIVTSYDNELHLNLIIFNNIFYDTGVTSGSGNFPNNMSLHAYYNDVNDSVLWEIFQLGTILGNISENPEFMDPEKEDFHLKPISLCINAGHTHNQYYDPDGSRNDMGAYGGPKSIIRPIRIINPVHEETIIADIENPIPINIQWNAYKLTSNNYVEIEMYHIEYEQAAPDKGNNTPCHYIGKKVYDLENILVFDTGSWSFNLNQQAESQFYYLTIRDPFVNIGDFEKINFIISSEQTSIQSN